MGGCKLKIGEFVWDNCYPTWDIFRGLKIPEFGINSAGFFHDYVTRMNDILSPKITIMSAKFC